jgi:hypothetical protein
MVYDHSKFIYGVTCRGNDITTSIYLKNKMVEIFFDSRVDKVNMTLDVAEVFASRISGVIRKLKEDR